MTFAEYPLHDSPRGWFGRSLYFEMEKNPNIVLISIDLGYKLFDLHKADMPGQYICTGASEQAAIGIAVGLSLSGKVPVVYSITSFLLYRAFEWHRNLLNHEKIPVLLAGSGLDKDYEHDGITHQTSDAKAVLNLFPNIKTYFPDKKEEIPSQLKEMISQQQPAFICLRR